MYINLLTQAQTTLPRTITVGGKTVSNPTLADCVSAGLPIREVKDAPTASVGSQIVAVTWVQDSKDATKTTPVVETKTDTEIAAEKAAAEQAAADAQAASAAERAEWIENNAKAFPDEKQAGVIRDLSERTREK